jgi:hypothetical protein
MMKKILIIAVLGLVASASLSSIVNRARKVAIDAKKNPTVKAILGDIASMLGKPVKMTAEEAFAHPVHVIDAFTQFKQRFNRVYEGTEHFYRLGVFADNLKYIQDFNAKSTGKNAVKLGVTAFADMTHEEFKEEYVGGLRLRPESERNVVTLSTANMADSVDWRTKGAVTPVKNQEQCGSCWAFSAVAAMEGAYFQKNGSLKSFSEQQLVDCSKKEGNHGCQGGLMDYAFKYAESNKMEQESDYKYKAKNGQCEYAASKGVFNTVSFNDVKSDNVEQLQAASTGQVVSVAIEAD